LDQAITVIMPACDAVGTIGPAVASLIAQTHGDWRLMLVSDDGRDYGAQLATDGLADPRITHLSTGRVRAGSTIARNLALDRMETRYAAILDADDRYKPEKLARVLQALRDCPIVTTALEIIGVDGRPARTVGTGPDRVFTAGEHKWVNFSMDSMVAWDRTVCDARYDPALANMTDLDFLMKLYRTSPVSAHLGAPLHDYVKRAVSMSNGPGVTERMIRAKITLRARLAEGLYPMAAADGREGIDRFLAISLEAERSYPAALADRPGLLFEDHLEPLLKAASTSAA
jgi:glycosyltransferase involved in cell wall biosynthesis